MQHHRGAAHGRRQVGEAGVVADRHLARAKHPGDAVERPAGGHHDPSAPCRHGREQGLLARASRHQHRPPGAAQRPADRHKPLGRVALGGAVADPRAEDRGAPPAREVGDIPSAPQPAGGGEGQLDRCVPDRREAEVCERLIQVVALVPPAADRERAQAEAERAAAGARQPQGRAHAGEERLGARAVAGGESDVETPAERAPGPAPPGAGRPGHDLDGERAGQRQVG
ncbi:MAG TPA: hypothetical protein P5234_13475 [Thermoanaerobaculaceae bacterium]|nr:hypothetical protein [Thermoanaerobaculaceae bacterium]HRS17242.1 hypothetical protein [Thermoanaerobaculaceae bacterium]